MKQMMARLLAEVRTNREEMKKKRRKNQPSQDGRQSKGNERRIDGKAGSQDRS
jgi:hypothetical protein